jgi:hypothetical protein
MNIQTSDDNALTWRVGSAAAFFAAASAIIIKDPIARKYLLSGDRRVGITLVAAMPPEAADVDIAPEPDVIVTTNEIPFVLDGAVVHALHVVATKFFPTGVAENPDHGNDEHAPARLPVVLTLDLTLGSSHEKLALVREIAALDLTPEDREILLSLLSQPG